MCNPALVECDASYRELFCDKCGRLFDVSDGPDMLSTARVSFEQVYTLDQKGHSIRRAKMPTSLEVEEERSRTSKAASLPQSRGDCVP